MWRVFAMAAALVLALPAAAWASVGDDVRAQCATTAWGGETCGRLARIVDTLAASEEVSDALAREVEALPVDQRQWLVDVLGRLEDNASTTDAVDEDANGEDFSTMAATDPDAQPRRPRDRTPSVIRKVRDFIRRTLG